MQKQWSSLLNPLLSVSLTQGALLPNVKLVMGNNTFNHYLGRQMQGWFIVDINQDVSIYRSQPLNSQTLTLNSSDPVTVSLWVF